MPMTLRTSRSLHLTSVAAVAAVLLVTACSPSDSDGDGSPAQDTGLETFYSQTLRWGACDGDFATSPREADVLAQSSAECARLAVPLDYSDPEGEPASVAVSRIAARGEAQGSLVFNPGGPGGSGVLGTVALAAGLADSRISEKFDIVSFDPRGVGATVPAADCYTPDGTTRGDDVFPTLQSNVSLSEEDTRAVLERCASGSGGEAALAQMGTRTTAKDMDVLRAALGDEQLSFLGQSYGTRLGAVYAEEFPERVRALVLDGAFDPHLGTIDRLASSYIGFQRSFDAMAESCAAQADCPLGSDPAAATEVFQSIVRPLREKPVPALDEQLDFDGAVGGVIVGLYAPELWPTILGGITELTEGRGDALLQLSVDLQGADELLVNGNMNDALFAINCMDESRLAPDEVTELKTRTYEQAPFMDPGVISDQGARDGCEFWPAEPTLGFPYATDTDGLPDTLVVSQVGDPTTPHANAISLADTLGGDLLTVEGSGHTVVSSGVNTCVDQIASDYLIDLVLPAEMPSCAA